MYPQLFIRGKRYTNTRSGHVIVDPEPWLFGVQYVTDAVGIYKLTTNTEVIG